MLHRATYGWAQHLQWLVTPSVACVVLACWTVWLNGSCVPVFHPDKTLHFVPQSDVWEENLRDGEQCPASVPGQSLRLLPDQGTCVFCNGVCSWRGLNDAHPCRCVLRATCSVSDHIHCWMKVQKLKPPIFRPGNVQECSGGGVVWIAYCQMPCNRDLRHKNRLKNIANIV